MEEEKIQENLAEEAVAETPVADEPAAVNTPAADEVPVAEESVAVADEVAAADEPVAAEEPIAVTKDVNVEADDNPPIAEEPIAEQVTTTDEPVAQDSPVDEPVAETKETAVQDSPADESVPIVESYNEEDFVDSSSEKSTATAQKQPKAPRPKFKFKLWMAIAAGLVVALLISGTILGFIPYRNLDQRRGDFSGWDMVHISDAEGHFVTIRREHLDSEHDSIREQAQAFEQGLNSTAHSLLRSLFMFNYVNDLRFRLRESHSRLPQFNEDGYRYRAEDGEWVYIEETNDVRIERTLAQAHTDTQTQAGTFLLDFRFPSLTPAYIQAYYEEHGVRPTHQPQYIYIRDNSTEARDNRERNVRVYFDRVRLLINDSYGDISTFVLFIYNYDDFIATAINPYAAENRINPVEIRMRTSVLYERLMDIREHYRHNRDNGVYVPQPDLEDGDDMNDVM